MYSYTQYGTDSHYIIVEKEIRIMPITRQKDTYYSVRCGLDYKVFSNKSEVVPYIIKTYGEIKSKKVIVEYLKKQQSEKKETIKVPFGNYEELLKLASTQF